MAEYKLDERERLVDLFAVAERARKDHHGAFETAFEHGLERDAVGNAAVQEFSPVNLDDLAQNREACRCADAIHVVFVAVVQNARVFGKTCLDICHADAKFGLLALGCELVKFKRVNFIRNLLVAVVKSKVVAREKQIPEAHVSRTLGMYGIDAKIATDLPRKKTAQVRGACRGAACPTKLDFFVGEYVKNAAGIRPA